MLPADAGARQLHSEKPGKSLRVPKAALMITYLKCPECRSTEPAASGLLGRTVRRISCPAVFRVTNAELKWVDETETPEVPPRPRRAIRCLGRYPARSVTGGAAGPKGPRIHPALTGGHGSRRRARTGRPGVPGLLRRPSCPPSPAVPPVADAIPKPPSRLGRTTPTAAPQSGYATAPEVALSSRDEPSA